MTKRVEPNGDSRFNPLEAELVVKKVNELIECGVKPEHDRRHQPLLGAGAFVA